MTCCVPLLLEGFSKVKIVWPDKIGAVLRRFLKRAPSTLWSWAESLSSRFSAIFAFSPDKDGFSRSPDFVIPLNLLHLTQNFRSPSLSDFWIVIDTITNTPPCHEDKSASVPSTEHQPPK
jgi:hypothetical protein